MAGHFPFVLSRGRVSVQVVVFAAALGFLLMLVAATPTADSAPRNGFWGGGVRSTACFEDGCARVRELGYFKVRSREVTEVGYNVLVACYNRDTRDTYDVFFTVDQGEARARFSSRGVARFTQQRSSDGRRGRVSTVMDLSGNRPTMEVRMRVGGPVERCNGRTTIPVAPPRR
jgi:hypothetical protein